MPFAAPVITTLSVQLLIGSLLHGLVKWVLPRLGAGQGGLRRRWIVAWSETGRALLCLAPFAAVTLVFGVVLAGRTTGGAASALDGVWFQPPGFLLLGAAPTASCYLMLHAGRLEATGRLRLARAVARLSGELFFVGALSQLIFIWSELLFYLPVRRALVESVGGAGLAMLCGMVATGCAAFVAVTAGLAGKPRPASWFATIFFLFGESSLIAAHQIATG
jgi:hypothetical protein